MRILLFVLLLASPLASFAADDNAAKERLERHLRTLRIVELSEQLSLTSTQAVKLDEIMRAYDERRRPYRDQLIEYGKILKKAAEGDSSAAARVDEAIERTFDLRAQVAEIDRDMLRVMSKELTAQQRARMALVFGSLRDLMNKEIQKMRPAEARKSPEK